MLALGLAVGGVCGSAGATDFSDGSFPDSSWTATKIIDTTPSAGATFTSAQGTTWGNPDEYRTTSHTFGMGQITVAHFNSAASWSPPPGIASIASISVSYDLVYTSGPPLGAVRYKFALSQGGSIYEGPFDDIFAMTWTPHSHTGLLATDFTLVSGGGPANPDFGCNAAKIEFGYTTSNSQGGMAPSTKVSGIDNWSVTIEKDACEDPGVITCCGDGLPPNITACPCGNTGATCNGCANSVNPFGASLTATGIRASEFGGGLGPDTVTLTASGMPTTALTILLQGTVTFVPGVIFGDGVRCCGGSLLRLGVKVAQSGSVSYGYPTPQKLSIAGMMPPGQVACYQIYYRDPPSSFCPPDTFNVTNAVTISWL